MVDGEEAVEEDSDEVVLKKALLILNKLSLTTFEKLSQELVDLGIARNEACLKGIIELIVENAHVQPHFASMYALLCAQLSQWQVGGKKVFKKMLLTQCQLEFEKDTSAKVQEAIANIEDPEEREYQAALIKKNYLGHMRFIGELYKNDMIKIDIMLWCLKTLLEDDEEQLECFTKLMTTSGGSLEQQAVALRDQAGKPTSYIQLQECWKVVDQFTKTGPSNRIKFMLQDLLDLRANGWVERRQKETAKTMDQIRKEVAKEERNRGKGGMPSKPSVGLGRRSSTGDVRLLDKKPVVDEDGFTQVARTSLSSSIGVGSSLAMAAVGKKPSGSSMRRAVSLPSAQQGEKPAAPVKSFPSPDDCSDQSKKLLKEYFIGGDIDDAVLSIDEMVGFGHDGSIERGAKVIEGGTLLVLEMKDEEVNKFLTILLRCLKENKIQRKSIAMGMNDPLEFLGDIEIDAPLARSHLVKIVAELIKEQHVGLDFLLESPEYFREEGKAGSFAAKVQMATGGEITDADLDVIEKLMTADDKATHATAHDLLASL
jgi:translation initiation factor 4G